MLGGEDEHEADLVRDLDVGTFSPIQTPTHDIANVTTRRMPTPARNSSPPAWTRQPTASPDRMNTTTMPVL